MSLLSPQIDTKSMVPVCRQLATSFDAGIPIIKTLEHVGQNSKDGKVKRVLMEMSDSLRNGSTLGDAAHAQSKYLSPFFVQLLAVGERGGHIDVMLTDLAQYFEDRLQLQRKIRGMMFMPFVQLVFAWYLGTFALGMIDVINAGIEGRGGGGSGVSEYFSQYLNFQRNVGLVFIAIIVLAVILSRFGVLGWITGAFTTFIWPLSVVTRKFALARFFRSFALLLGSGLGMTKCIEGSATVTGNPYISAKLENAIDPIKHGATLSEALDVTGQLTPMAREMIVVGEQAGSLEKQMNKVSEYHLAEASAAVEMATKIFGFMILLAVGILIGYIVISFYSNLYGGMMDGMGI